MSMVLDCLPIPCQRRLIEGRQKPCGFVYKREAMHADHTALSEHQLEHCVTETTFHSVSAVVRSGRLVLCKKWASLASVVEGRQVRAGRQKPRGFVLLISWSGWESKLALAAVCCQAGARESSKCAVLLPAAKGEPEAGGALMLQ